MLYVISVICYLIRICVYTSYHCELVVGLRARFCTLLEVWVGWELGCWHLIRKRSVRRGSGAPSTDGPGAWLHTTYIQPTYIPPSHKIVGTQFCVTLSHPSFRTFSLKRMDHTDIKSKDFLSGNKTHTYSVVVVRYEVYVYTTDRIKKLPITRFTSKLSWLSWVLSHKIVLYVWYVTGIWNTESTPSQLVSYVSVSTQWSYTSRSVVFHTSCVLYLTRHWNKILLPLIIGVCKIKLEPREVRGSHINRTHPLISWTVTVKTEAPWEDE